VNVTDMEFSRVLDLLRNMILRKSSDGGGSSGSIGGDGIGRMMGDGIIPLKSLGFAPFFVPSSRRQRNGGRDRGLVSSGSGGFLSSLIWSGTSNGTVDAVGNGRWKGSGRLDGGMAWNIARNRQLYAFSSTVKRIRMNHGSSTKSSSLQEDSSDRQSTEEVSSFVQYEITCQLTVQCTNKRREGGDRHISWSVWKRYSEFQSLDAKLRKALGWHVTDLNGGWGVAFPSSHHLRCLWVTAWNDSGDAGGGCKNNKLWQKQERPRHFCSRGGATTRVNDRSTTSITMHQKFVRKRREEMKRYWDALGECEEMFDFADPSLHRYSRDMANFLGLERYFPRNVGGSGMRATANCGGGGSGGSVIGHSSLQGKHRCNYNVTSTIKRDASIISQQSSQLSSRCDQSTGRDLQPLDENNLDGEIILTKEIIDTSSLLASSTLRCGGGGQKQKRITAAAKPAFQRRLLDSL